MQKKLLALLLRGSSMGSKFILIIGMSKILTTSEYGVFSLILTTLTFLIFFLGLDFYNYSHREIIDNNEQKVKFLINQFWFHLFCYLLYIPIVYYIFRSNIIPYQYLLPFYILLVLEHIGQELFRFFNLFNKPNQANLSLLIRTAVWVSIMLLVEYAILKRELTIMTVIYYWIFGSFLSILYSLIYMIFKGGLSVKEIQFFSIDKKWIKAGIKISIPFFFGTIAYKIIEYSDRYMIDWFLGKDEVGIYSFFSNFANILNIIVNTITVTLVVPNLLRAISDGNTDTIKTKTSKFLKELFLTTIFVSLLIILAIFPILSWLDKSEFTDEIIVYFIILLANIIFNLSLYYHYLLYAYKQDKSILKPSIYASLVNIVLNIIFVPKLGIIAAAFSTLASFIVLFILKRKYWKEIKTSKIEY